MKKIIAIILSLLIMISGTMVACQKKDGGEGGADVSVGGLDDSTDEIELVDQQVTDKDGNAVTDANGQPVTEEVAALVTQDSKGKTYGIVLDANGDPVKDKNGKTVTVKVSSKGKSKKKSSSNKKSSNKKDNKKDSGNNGGNVSPDTPQPEPEKVEPIDNKKEETTPNSSTNRHASVPKTSDSGKEVNINSADMTAMTSMLEAPGLYNGSYESGQPVPNNIASYAALWMLQREGTGMTSFPSGTVVIDLFKFYGQTVVNYKSNCNKAGVAEIQYKADTDTFSVSGYKSKQQSVKITSVQDLGNNYFKVTAKVSNVDGKSKVIAIMQKNKLDLSLGFSIKALKWS